MIAKIIIGGAVILGATVGLAAPASADVVFNQFSCACGAPPPFASPVVADRINQGIFDAETRQLP
ncbi:hypothetical protein [Mycobacterium montefiorense]|uniref:Uncharacterized protein n=1 Tax=Mycobacterium montefiorense TaxID=154654 RepID=A0AA37UWG9_9MYCO|nr:hypothetical protein [Mycobacterium montefiorense]GBG37079.1 hypothetical protein MmonteBS_14510 [Mycobacterium montefiorense]GKU36824.1 hypothetical protein NJB14191_41700 [Mycobacterium montefiorense]GKU42943.1 hypothetical protein NJB14192_49260 [Mycobacterium montefiorense]GKU48383.1 hypothetical protein NJB14194_49980 [Mycobacterium montefiorense]GKU50884.1 hypothetical protein NJB14195_21300 [Mycobacterium montefiorense]